MSTTDTKSWYLSKTVIAGIVTLLVSVMAAVGIGGIEGQTESVTELIFQIVTAVAGIVAIAGRLTATKKVTK